MTEKYQTAIEEFTYHWSSERSSFDGPRVILEGSYMDTTHLISGFATTLRQDLPKLVREINLDGFHYKMWPDQQEEGEVVNLTRRDFDNFTISYLPWIRAVIMEDGRVFVVDSQYNNQRYLNQILAPTLEIAKEKFSGLN